MHTERFSLTISGLNPVAPLLPLVHTCEAYRFRSIFENQRIKPNPCDVFVGDSLAYFFYGKPSYRTSSDISATSMTSMVPVCFVISAPENLIPKRVFPLDTGAFHGGRFSKYFHRETLLDDLSLPARVDSAGKVVARYFGSNKAYFNSETKEIDLSPLDFEAQSYIQLINDKSITDFDDRRSSIELQYEEEIDLSTVKVHLVVLPTRFLDVPEISDRIFNDWKAEARTYHIAHWNPNEYLSTLYRELREYFSDKGFL